MGVEFEPYIAWQGQIHLQDENDYRLVVESPEEVSIEMKGLDGMGQPKWEEVELSSESIWLLLIRLGNKIDRAHLLKELE